MEIFIQENLETGKNMDTGLQHIQLNMVKRMFMKETGNMTLKKAKEQNL